MAVTDEGLVEAASAGAGVRTPYRIAFVMQQVLGHVTAYHHLRRYVAEDATVDPSWTEVTFTQPGGWIERLPGVPAHVRGVARGVLQVRNGLGVLPYGTRSPFDAVLFNSQSLCLTVRHAMRRIPSVITTDVTPLQMQRLAAHYGRARDDSTPLGRLRHRAYVEVFHAARVLAPWSTWARDSLVNDYGVPAERVQVIPPGVDLGAWAPPPPGTRAARLAQPGALPRLLFVGGDFERKGGPLLLDWFARAGVGRCELTMVTRSAPHLEHLPPGLSISTGLEATDPRLRQLYAESDLFVLPTQADCFGLALIEAMATGMPVVTTSTGGVPDIVEDGAQGVLLAPGDARGLAGALDALLADPAQRAAMGTAARARAERSFDARLYASRILGALKQAARSA